jgi:hypothetical protein
MKISEYIRLLQRVERLYGDVEIVDANDEPIQKVTTLDHFGKAISHEFPGRSKFVNPAAAPPRH